MTQPVFEYKITADDYLTHQLFSASMNSMVKKQRKRGLILWTSAFFILALLFYIQKNTHLAIYFSLFGLVFIFIYPFYSAWIYRRYYKRFVNKNFKSANIESLSLKIETDIIISNGKEEGLIPVSDVERIYEIPSHIFIKLNEGKNIIIPKQKTQNTEELLNKVTYLAEKNNIDYIKYPNWKWK